MSRPLEEFVSMPFSKEHLQDMMQTLFTQDESQALVNALSVFLVHLTKENPTQTQRIIKSTQTALAKVLGGIPIEMSKDLQESMSKYGVNFSLREIDVQPNQGLVQ